MTHQKPSDVLEVVPATQNVPQESRWSKFETVFTNAKAGMGGVDKEHVKRIVYEMSKVEIRMHSNVDNFHGMWRLQPLQLTVLILQDSPHFKNEQRKQAQTEQRIQKLKTKAKALLPAEMAASTK